MKLDVWKMKLDTLAVRSLSAIGIEIPEGLQLRGVIDVVGERYRRDKYKEDRECGRCGMLVPVSASASGISCVVRGYEYGSGARNGSHAT